MRFDAVGHFLGDGDYKADHEGDFAGAFADYLEAWSLLVTPTARWLAGSDILDAIAEFAAKSGIADLQEEAAALVAAHEQEISQRIDKTDAG